MGRELSDRHRAALEGSGIAPDVITERGYFTIEKKTELGDLGFGRSQWYAPTLVIPVHGVIGDAAEWFMHRPDETPLKDGRARKYLIPGGARMTLDVHPRVRPGLGDPSLPLFVTEGAKKADALITAGAKAVVAVPGVWNWRGSNAGGGKTIIPDWEWVALKDSRQVYVVYDSDVALKEPVRLAMDRLGQALSRMGARVAFVYLPSGPAGEKVGADDYLASGKTLQDVVSLATTTLRKATSPQIPEGVPTPDIDITPVSLEDAVATYQEWLYLPDPEALYVLWGSIVANRLPGDPVWMLVVGASGGGKTEIVRACGDLPECAHISALTEAGLLSGTPKAEQAEDATGGVLRVLGARGVIVAKDFTSVLAMEKDSRSKVLAALREIYDGHWARPLGTDGGRLIEWEGKAGLVGGVTHEIDRQHAVMARMGERLLLYRLPPQNTDKTVNQAVDNAQATGPMRAALRAAALGVFAAVDSDAETRKPSDVETRWIVELAKLTAKGRAGVVLERGEIMDVIQPEVPTRLAMQLAALLHGMDAIGVERPMALRALTNTAFGCIPDMRRTALWELYRCEEQQTTTTQTALDGHVEPSGPTASTGRVATALRLPTNSVRRGLQALTAHGLVVRVGGGKGKADLWGLSEETRGVLDMAEELLSMSADNTPSGIRGTV